MFRNVCDDEYFNESRVAGPVNAIVLIIADTVIQCWYFAIHVNSPAHFSIPIRCNEYISVNEFSSFMGNAIFSYLQHFGQAFPFFRNQTLFFIVLWEIQNYISVNRVH